MYNQKKKEGFLLKIDVNILTQKQYKMFFEHSRVIEEKYNIDLKDFSIEQCEEVLRHIKPTNNKAVKVYCSFINRYVSHWKNGEWLFRKMPNGYWDQFVYEIV